MGRLNNSKTHNQPDEFEITLPVKQTMVELKKTKKVSVQ